MVAFRECSVADALAHELLAEYFAEREATFPSVGGYRVSFPAADQFELPRGIFLLVDSEDVREAEDVRVAGDVGIVGCGGIRRIEDGVGLSEPVSLSENASDSVRFEVKHLYLRPTARGLGAGRALLRELEHRAADLGATSVVLDTNASLEAAGGLYRSSGYADIPPYNDNPNATNWYGKSLSR